MSVNSTERRVYHERHDHVLKIVIDNSAKKNAFSPEMMEQLSDAVTLPDKEEDLWVGLLCANGDNFTAGLDMPISPALYPARISVSSSLLAAKMNQKSSFREDPHFVS
jgi:enoyl-CoA hydratase/carnithine racemase